MIEQFLIMDPRFALGGPGDDSSLQISGAAHISRPAIEKIFADDEGVSVYLIPLAERRDAISLLAVAAIESNARAVLERLMELSPPPDAEISVDSALADPLHFAAWRNDILEIYYGMWGPRAGKKDP